MERKNSASHSRLIFGACLVAFALAPIAEADASCPVAGRYVVVGRTPGATGSYQGEAVITDKGQGCYMTWFPPNASEGAGEYSNGTLTVHFTFANGGASGVVKYTRAPNGDLHGVWWTNDKPNNWGTESLLAAH